MRLRGNRVFSIYEPLSSIGSSASFFCGFFFYCCSLSFIIRACDMEEAYCMGNKSSGPFSSSAFIINFRIECYWLERLTHFSPFLAHNVQLLYITTLNYLLKYLEHKCPSFYSLYLCLFQWQRAHENTFFLDRRQTPQVVYVNRKLSWIKPCLFRNMPQAKDIVMINDNAIGINDGKDFRKWFSISIRNRWWNGVRLSFDLNASGNRILCVPPYVGQ